MTEYYVLNERHEIIEASRKRWKKFFNSSARVVKDTTINNIRIITNFIGINNTLFETTVFNYNNDNRIYRFKTYQAVLNYHNYLSKSIENAYQPINHIF